MEKTTMSEKPTTTDHLGPLMIGWTSLLVGLFREEDSENESDAHSNIHDALTESGGDVDADGGCCRSDGDPRAWFGKAFN